MVKIDIDQLSSTIAEELANYGKLIDEGFEETKKKTANNVKKDIQSGSPKRHGDYQKGWKVKKRGNAFIIHNDKHYRLTHLLEKGHAKKNGTGRVKAQPHIAPAEERNISEFLREIERMIKR